jgi:hypothetical protein
LGQAALEVHQQIAHVVAGAEAEMFEGKHLRGGGGSRQPRADHLHEETLIFIFEFLSGRVPGRSR